MPRRRQQLHWTATTSLFLPNVTIRRYHIGTPPTPSPTPTEPDSELSPDAETEPDLEPEVTYQEPPAPLPLFIDNLYQHIIAETGLSVFTHSTPYINTRYLVIIEALRPINYTLGYC